MESLSSCTPDFRLELGHAGFFRAIADGLPITADQREEIRSLIESKNYAALESLLDGLEQTPAVEAMRRLPRLFGGEEVFAQAAPLCGSEEAAAMLEYLHSLYKSLSALGLGNRLMVDLGLVQRNDYYTGVVFSAYAQDCGDAILLGGRYDNLLGHFDLPMPAIGFSVNVDAVVKLLAEQGYAPECSRPDVLVYGCPGHEVKALLYASGVTSQGGSCETSVFETEEESIEYARRRGIPNVAIVGQSVKEYSLADNTEIGEGSGMKPLRIALTKGRLEKDTVALLDRIGYDCEAVRNKGRRLILRWGTGWRSCWPRRLTSSPMWSTACATWASSARIRSWSTALRFMRCWIWASAAAGLRWRPEGLRFLERVFLPHHRHKISRRGPRVL